jgi:inner membrane protein YidH
MLPKFVDPARQTDPAEVNVIDNPYEEFRREEMILRDWLALDRTVLANKRTFLAYGRTSIALIALGIAFVKLIGHRFFETAGFSLMGFGVAVFGIGLREFLLNAARFKQLAAKERFLEQKLRGAPPPDEEVAPVPAPRWIS